MLRSRQLAFALAAFTAQAPSAVPAQSPTLKIVSAANAFLATLSPRQRDSVVFAFDDKAQRARWSNFPTGIVQRAGLSLGGMTAPQRDAAMKVMAAALSARGYEKVEQIMEADEVLKSTDSGGGGGPPGRAGAGGPPGGRGGRGGRDGGGRGPGGPGGGGGLLFGRELYFISFMGTPSERTPWMLQFGGHHLAVNLTIAGAQGILTPTLTGAQPAMYTVAGKTIRPLGAESDKALALLQSLNDTQRKQAILAFRVADLVLGPGQDDVHIQPEGLKASAMTPAQRTMLLDLMGEWSGIVHESAAAARMAELKADIAETWFAWSGPTTADPGKNITAYYRIQGPKIVIEYAPQGMGGDPALHLHTMYRDPTNDYGRKASGGR